MNIYEISMEEKILHTKNGNQLQAQCSLSGEMSYLAFRMCQKAP